MNNPGCCERDTHSVKREGKRKILHCLLVRVPADRIGVKDGSEALPYEHDIR